MCWSCMKVFTKTELFIEESHGRARYGQESESAPASIAPANTILTPRLTLLVKLTKLKKFNN